MSSVACEEDAPQIVPAGWEPIAGLGLEAAEPRLPRLTRVQYRQAIAHIFGPDVVVPAGLEPDTPQHGLVAIGATVASVSPLGVERYDGAAFSIAEQVVVDGIGGGLPCEPTGVGDVGCLEDAARSWARRIWRRPATEEEVDALVAVGLEAASTLGDASSGLTYVLATLLQSPYFLYRLGLGQPAQDGGRAYTDWEMASRLSFFLWNSTPDHGLLDAAEAGDLVDDEGLSAQAQRLLASPGARIAVRNLFAEWLDLYALDELNKDPTVFKHFSADVGAAAREETLRVVERLVFEEDADLRELLTTRTTFVNRRLAAIYNVPAVEEEGFAEITLPADGPRSGLLGHASFLALQAHAESSSPTKRGMFVRERLLCHEIPSPPSNVNTAIPEPASDAVTLKERLQVHMENPACAGCHALMDPVGFAFEHFDGMGRYRILDNGGVIETSGYLDDDTFADAEELAAVLVDHPDFVSCFVRNVYAYATGHAPTPGEKALLATLTTRFKANGHRVLGLLFDIAMSPGFRRVAEVTP